MPVSVVVGSARATVLWVSQQRFTMCVDPLTLRLFHKVRAHACMHTYGTRHTRNTKYIEVPGASVGASAALRNGLLPWRNPKLMVALC